MATGDDALAAGMDVVAGTVAANTIDTEITKTRDYIAQRTSTVTPISKGGTGATSAGAARTALGISAAATQSNGVLGTGAGSNNLQADIEYLWAAKPTRTTAEYNADLAYADAQSTAKMNTRLWLGGGTLSGDLYLPTASAATSGFTAAYINGDGRVSRGSSSIRYKDLLDDPDVSTLGDIWPTLRSYTIKGGDGQAQLGYIAEELADNPATDRFVVRYGDPERIESIDFIQLLLAQVAQLNARVAMLETSAQTSA